MGGRPAFSLRLWGWLGQLVAVLPMILYFVSSLPCSCSAHPQTPCAGWSKLGGRIYISRTTPRIQWVTPHKGHDLKISFKKMGCGFCQMDGLHASVKPKLSKTCHVRLVRTGPGTISFRTVLPGKSLRFFWPRLSNWCSVVQKPMIKWYWGPSEKNRQGLGG